MASATVMETGAAAALAAGREYGRSGTGDGERVQVEFVSADPTGPLTLLHGRSAVLGDVLGNLLQWTGHHVSREFYVNDAGRQIERFHRSIEVAYLQLLGRPTDPAEDAYPSEYARALAQRLLDREGARCADLPEEERHAALGALARDEVLRRQRTTLERLGVHFDCWYSERELHRGGQIDAVVGQLRGSGAAYDVDGALWLRASDFGDDQDRALIRTSGVPTYIAADMAYHMDKFRRGFDRVINLWGPDHESYVARTRAGLRSLEVDPDRLEVLILQPVSLKVDGLQVDDSTRTMGAIMLDEVIEEVGTAATRFAYLAADASSPLELDLDLARRADDENPAHRVLGALARADAILGEARGGSRPPGSPEACGETGAALDRELARFPNVVATAARERAPHQVADYAGQVASLFHQFCSNDPKPPGKPANGDERLGLVEASRIVLDNAATILGVSAPERR